MIRPPPCFLFLLFCAACAAAQTKPPNFTPNPPENDVQVSFRPSIAVVVGIFSIMISFTFLLLMYAKFCHSNAAGNFGESIPNNLAVGGSTGDEGRSSGIDKVLIESLPFFRFSALKGSRKGLECAVCLARFEDNDILRLLPRCKHAFHMDCIDRWLDSHSSCPLCRTRIAADDLACFKYSASSRFFLRDPSGRSSVPDPIETGDAALELFVEREHVGSSSMRFTASFRSAERSKKDRESLLPSGGNDIQASALASNLHTLKHRIIVSDVVFQGRWSDFNSADLISLDSEMLRLTASRMESKPASPQGNAAALDGEWVPRIREEMERKRRSESRGNHSITRPPEVISSEYSAMDMTALISSASRCMSDITAVTRHRSPPVSNQGEKEERAKQIWLPIARRTVERFAGKERGFMLQPQNTGDGVEKV